MLFVLKSKKSLGIVVPRLYKNITLLTLTLQTSYAVALFTTRSAVM